jgi:predicted lipoprotein with Yx(FWY)xxD motif
MQQFPATGRPRSWLFVAVLAAVAAAIGVAFGDGDASARQAASAGAGTRMVVRQAQNESLGHPVLTNDKGLTLYSLSVEKNGRFICTDPACLSLWHPLLVPAGVKPTGPVPLGTVRRPKGGGIQVTDRGRPLYHFVEDAKPGETNGEGFKDVGTWHAASGSAPTAAPQPESPPSEYPGSGYRTSPGAA